MTNGPPGDPSGDPAGDPPANPRADPAVGTVDDPGETRRDRLRREVTEDIVRIARDQLTAAGPGAVTWRAIAREIGMNPASLYTYFDSLDALYTRLIVDSSTALGATVQTAFDEADPDEPLERAVACALAYRRWALQHPAEFNLVFTDQIPGYEAPADSGTFDAEMTIFRPLTDAVGAVTGTTAELPRAPGLVRETPEPTDAAEPSLVLFGLMHGLVSLEVNNHLPRGGEADRFEQALRSALATLSP